MRIESGERRDDRPRFTRRHMLEQRPVWRDVQTDNALVVQAVKLPLPPLASPAGALATAGTVGSGSGWTGPPSGLWGTTATKAAGRELDCESSAAPGAEECSPSI
jgi:hypothetical protein